MLAIFTVIFATGYGLLVDGLIWILKARKSDVEVNARRFTLAITLATAIIGLIAYGTTVALKLLPRNSVAEIFILTGLLGGYLGVIVWRRAGRSLIA